jgi:hypothetical protein
VKAVITTEYKTPKDLKIPFCDVETGTLELIVLPSDLVAATEVVASAVERGTVALKTSLLPSTLLSLQTRHRVSTW